MRVLIDDTQARARLAAVVPNAEKAAGRARSDAARQTRTKAYQGIGQKLNLPAAEIRSRVRVVRAGPKTTDVRATYAPVPAHKFRGWRYVATFAGRRVSQTAKASRFARRGKGGLTVKFRKDKPALHFPGAFRSMSIGHGRVFVVRVKPLTGWSQGRPHKWVPNLPIAAITGPSVHALFAEGLRVYASHGTAAYERRIRYWLDEYQRRSRAA